jgi:hypothetical protein
VSIKEVISLSDCFKEGVFSWLVVVVGMVVVC